MRKLLVCLVLLIGGCASFDQQQVLIQAKDVQRVIELTKLQIGIYNEVARSRAAQNPTIANCGNGTFLPEITSVDFSLAITSTREVSINLAGENTPNGLVNFNNTQTRTNSQTLAFKAKVIPSRNPDLHENLQDMVNNAPIAADLIALTDAARGSGQVKSPICLEMSTADDANSITLALTYDRNVSGGLTLLHSPLTFGGKNTRNNVSTITVHFVPTGNNKGMTCPGDPGCSFVLGGKIPVGALEYLKDAGQINTTPDQIKTPSN